MKRLAVVRAVLLALTLPFSALTFGGSSAVNVAAKEPGVASRGVDVMVQGADTKSRFEAERSAASRLARESPPYSTSMPRLNPERRRSETTMGAIG